MLKKISTIDAVFMVLMAACGLSIKIIVGPLCKLIAVTLLIPVGSVAGAVYMIWPMLSILVVKKIGAASMVGLVQGIVVLITGFFGSHGILSLIIYTIPGVFIDIGFIIIRQFRGKWLLFFPPAMGNVSGSIIVGILILHTPKIPLLIALIFSFIFGGLGGYLSWTLYKGLIKTSPIFLKSDQKYYI